MLLARDGLPRVTIRVGEAVLAAGDPRYRPEDKGFSRYAADNDPWRWTDEQRTLAAALDLRDLLARMLCGPDADLAFAKKGSIEYRDPALKACAPALEVWRDAGDDAGSLLVGRPQDFGFRDRFGKRTPSDRERYRIRTVGDAVLLLGAEGAGVELAVWTFAARLGYRYLLPTETWEIVPDARGQDLAVPPMDEEGGPSRTEPGFLARQLTGPVAREEGFRHQAWLTRNGFSGGLQMKGVQGQWGRIVEQDLAWYAAHPGALSSSSRAWLRKRPAAAKFCPGYRDEQGEELSLRIFERWAAPRLATSAPRAYDNDLTRDQLALHHGDATFWWGCDKETIGGATPADRALALANRLAELARERDLLGERKVSVLAYREVFPGPRATRADPSVFVWLVGGGYMGVPFDQALSSWKAAGVRHLGLYLYWNAHASELPLDSGPQALVPTASLLAKREADGLRSLWVEASGGWGANGLFRWVLLQIAREPELARSDPEAAVQRWLSALLEPFPVQARPHLRAALDLLDASDQRLLLSPDWLADLHGALDRARDASLAAGDRGSAARVEDLLVYARHLTLYWRWKKGLGSYDDFIEHAACTEKRRMVDFSLLWGSAEPAAAAARTRYLQAHSGRSPQEVMAGRCPAPDFDAWRAELPARQLQGTSWIRDEAPRRWALPTAWPGTARGGGGYEGLLQGLPRDVSLWTVLLDPGRELRVRSACHGVLGRPGAEPARQHVTSRLLGEARVQLREPGTGWVACEAALPPDRLARDVAFSRQGARVFPSAEVSPPCSREPRELPLDTGAPPAEIEAWCRAGALQRQGPYELAILNHRMGFDYAALHGARGVVRWDTPRLPNEARRPEMGRSWRYFYVPLGTRKVTVWNGGGPCRVHRDKLAAHHVDLASGAPEYHAIDTVTPDGVAHDGQIWALSGCLDAYLVDVPPVVTPERELLMAPCDKVDDPGWAPLQLDASTCGR